MTTRGSCMVVTVIGSLLAVAASGHAESAWKLWQHAPRRRAARRGGRRQGCR
jgi:hypothetical protein